LPGQQKRTIDNYVGPTLLALEAQPFHFELVKDDYAARELKQILALKGLSGLAEILSQSSAYFRRLGALRIQQLNTRNGNVCRTDFNTSRGQHGLGLSLFCCIETRVSGNRRL
jgi:hypothetical protein